MAQGQARAGEKPGLDLHARLSPHWHLGGFAHYGYLFAKTPNGYCPAQLPCSTSGHDLRFGVEAQYHFLPDEGLDPWVGLGAGYESLALDETIGSSDDGAHLATTFEGFESAEARSGVDDRASNSGRSRAPRRPRGSRGRRRLRDDAALCRLTT